MYFPRPGISYKFPTKQLPLWVTKGIATTYKSALYIFLDLHNHQESATALV